MASNKRSGDSSSMVVSTARADSAGISFDAQQLDYLEHWITERDAIRANREAGKPKPWTADLILRNNRFCNVRRMDDKVSRWLMDNWYFPYSDATPRVLLTMATFARHINWPDSLEHFTNMWGSPKQPWNALWAQQKLDMLALKGKVFTGAYIINGAMGGSKIAQVVDRVDAVWNNAPEWVVPKGTHPTMAWMHAHLTNVPGIGSFIAGQIVADLRHTRVLAKANDAMLWAPRGPGSTRGMNRLLQRPVRRGGFSDTEWQRTITTLWRVMYARKAVRAVFDGRKCELMDLQNCLCEFDKYMRTLLGEGRCRNRYEGA